MSMRIDLGLKFERKEGRESKGERGKRGKKEEEGREQEKEGCGERKGEQGDGSPASLYFVESIRHCSGHWLLDQPDLSVHRGSIEGQ